MKINIVWGDLTDILAKQEALYMTLKFGTGYTI